MSGLHLSADVRDRGEDVEEETQSGKVHECDVKGCIRKCCCKRGAVQVEECEDASVPEFWSYESRA